MIKLGNQGDDVKQLQYKLGKVLNRPITLDGDFGYVTEKAVKDFQKMSGLEVDGRVGKNTYKKLEEVYRLLHVDHKNLLTFGDNRFVVFVDAGHGGIDDSGTYVTPGKRANHKGLELHERGHYYEGHENRLAAEAFIEKCTKAGIMCIRTYHPVNDTPLEVRTTLVKSYLDRGYYGYLHSFHSNAIGSSNTKQKLEATTGFIVFTTRGNNLSDIISELHYDNVMDQTPDWTHKRQARKDGDSDFEANFYVLRNTDLDKYDDRFGAILDEWGFHTSSKDCEYIVNHRKERVMACFLTALHVRDLMYAKFG